MPTITHSQAVEPSTYGQTYNTGDIVRGDGWQNVFLNMGTRGGRGDPVASTSYQPSPRLGQGILEDIFRSDGLGRRVVTLPVDDGLREWIEGDELLLAELRRIKTKQNLRDALYWGRLYGGGVLVALIDDGQDFDKPVREASVRRVLDLRAYDRHRITWTQEDLQLDPLQPGFGLPNVYTIQPLHGIPYRVHHTRLYRVDGDPLPDVERQQNEGWGQSVLQSVYDALRDYAVVRGSGVGIVRDFVQAVLGVKGLSQMLRSGNEKGVADRANVIDMTRSVANLAMIDADGETYEKKSASVAGLGDLLDRYALHVCTETGFPATKLLGRSPAGMNATGESDIRQYYDAVQSYRTDEIEPALTWLLNLLEMQRDWTDRPDAMDWQWPPLWQPSEKEWSEIKEINARADAQYLDRSAVDAEYLYHLRFGEGEYRADITYDHAAYLEWVAERDGLLGGDVPPTEAPPAPGAGDE